MAENSADPLRNPDVRTIRYLVRLMARYDLTAIDLVEGTSQIRLRRRSETSPAASGAGPSGSGAHLSPVQTIVKPVEDASAPGGAAAGTFIESPMVGTFYAASAPDAPPFVTVGSVVRPDTIVCVIEAMKVFTDIPAGVAGTVTEILVKNGQSVEFGQPLFRVAPA
jgi:acetyl-CoA carboxylase biotin carboxyl carrier protein